MTTVGAAIGTLRSEYNAAAETISIAVAFDASGPPPGSVLALTSLVQLTPTDDTDAGLVERLATYHELRPRTTDGATWTIPSLSLGHLPNHANDGPVSAFVILPDGSTASLDVEPMRRVGEEGSPPESISVELPALLPTPRSLDASRPELGVHTTASLAPGAPAAIVEAWQAIAGLVTRVGPTVTLDDQSGLQVIAVDDEALDDGGYTISVADGIATVAAGSAAGYRHAFVTLARWLGEGVPVAAQIEDAPHYAFRGLHIDLARQWFEPEVVLDLIDAAAWRKLSHLHLHLSDDEGWRLPIDAYPELAEIGATRGHELALPPMLGGGAAPVGRVYTVDEIADWVTRADTLGVELVPEIDLPAHVHAVLTALPQLRDPDDSSRATSVQFFTDNVLVPGHPATIPFVTAVIDAVVALFPTSPVIHIGGDEVPDGAWRGSPIVDRFRSEHGLGNSTADVEAEFHRQLVALIRERTGRRVGAWQEAAESGGVVPGDGYVVGWRTVEASRRLAALGYDVVVSPGQAYYLDMASDYHWDSPGMTWAGTSTFETARDFDPAAGWSPGERAHLLGVQACLWTEHVHSPEIMQRLLHPRLDAIANRAWTG